MGRGITVLICLLCVTLSAMAAAPDSLWSVRLGHSSHDVCNAVAPTTDGGTVLAGWARSTDTFGAGWYDFWLVKTDAAGQVVWDRRYGGPEGEGCFAVQPTPDGGFILAGMTGSFGEGHDGPSDAWVIKTNANGDSLWSRKFGGPLSDGFYAVQIAADGGYVFAGFTDSYGIGGRDFWLVKTTADGADVWSHTYGGGGFDECRAMAKTSTGFALAGVTNSWRERDQNFYLFNVDEDGQSLWTTSTGNGKVYGTTVADYCNAVAQTLDGGFVMAGSTYNVNADAEDFWMVRTRANGDSLLARPYGNSALGRDICYSIQATQDSSYVLAGITNGAGSGLWDAFMLKADPRGNVVYRRTFGGPERDNCYAMMKTTDGGFTLAGSTRSFGAAYEDFWQVKTGTDVLITPPGNFTLITPSTDTTFSSAAYTFPFRWHTAANLDAYDTLNYRLFISETPSFDPSRTDTTDPLRSGLTDTMMTFVWSRTVVANIPHYWKVQAMDMGGWSTWSSETRTFTVQGTAPTAFDLAYPADGAVIADSFSVKLGWFKATDVDPSDTRQYCVFVSADPAFAGADSICGPDSSALWSDLIVANQPTYWKVRVTDRHGLVTWSSHTWSFTISAHAPEPFELVSPADSAQIPDNSSVLLKWRASLDADSVTGDTVKYIVCVSRPDSFTVLDSVDVGVDTSRLWVNTLPAPHRYAWKVIAYDMHGLTTVSNTWYFDRYVHGSTGQPPQIQAPTVFKVHQNYPNPFNASTQISYDLPNAGWVTVKVFNVLGREVETLVNQNMPAGAWRTTFDATDLPSGIYILRVEAPGVSDLKKMILLK
ncbi:MAG TPA: T9SS type A sorting domain-containing protein [bacterium]